MAANWQATCAHTRTTTQKNMIRVRFHANSFMVFVGQYMKGPLLPPRHNTMNITVHAPDTQHFVEDLTRSIRRPPETTKRAARPTRGKRQQQQQPKRTTETTQKPRSRPPTTTRTKPTPAPHSTTTPPPTRPGRKTRQTYDLLALKAAMIGTQGRMIGARGRVSWHSFGRVNVTDSANCGDLTVQASYMKLTVLIVAI